ncbi:MAG: undecaprenyldiphospho-muramoylpentapeptide beta-N-acetylglucosaminyltransferase [Rikenellaceae bacterium]
MKKVILSGGGTAGHIYPAVAVAEALKRRFGDDVELLFVGAEGRMEMERVPALGYRIESLPIAGLKRGFYLSNLLLPFKIVQSLWRAWRIIKRFKPDVVVGFGGYASAPIVRAAQWEEVRTVIQEQNSYAGMTNKTLSKRADAICVAYEGMERFFPAERITLTGNPLRGSFGQSVDRVEALSHFGLKSDLPTILIVGGSLGTRTLNEMMKRWIGDGGAKKAVQVIWQTGRYYSEEMTRFVEANPAANVWSGPFIERMDYAYAAADIVISRSGASTVSELSLVGKATIFVPSPNVSEDHQTKNAQALVDVGAALLVADAQAVKDAMPLAEATLADSDKLVSLQANILTLGRGDAADRVVDIVIEKECF